MCDGKGLGVFQYQLIVQVKDQVGLIACQKGGKGNTRTNGYQISHLVGKLIGLRSGNMLFIVQNIQVIGTKLGIMGVV